MARLDALLLVLSDLTILPHLETFMCEISRTRQGDEEGNFHPSFDCHVSS
jgi:hypothetical protein